MTWLLLAFTWRALSISPQINNPYCVAYSVANCAGIYWIKEDPISIARNELYITFEWYGNDLVNLWRYNISLMYSSTIEDISSKLQHWPLIMRIPWWYKIDNFILPTWHHVCVVWENDDNWVVASWSKFHWIKWYSLVSKSITNVLQFQNFWSWTLTPSLITLTEKKEGSQEFKPVVKSATTSVKSTKKRFLKPLD